MDEFWHIGFQPSVRTMHTHYPRVRKIEYRVDSDNEPESTIQGLCGIILQGWSGGVDSPFATYQPGGADVMIDCGATRS